jgi:hypothetical protein
VASPILGDAVTKFVPRLVTPAVEYAFKYDVGTGSEGDVVDDRYCNGKVDV